MYAVIAENDISEWEDSTGIVYHFPKRYISIIPSGTKVIYYKGRIKNNSFKSLRLSDDPHYFGIAVIGKIYDDKKSKKNDKFATILEYKKFEFAVPIKIKDHYFEIIPETRKSNYWRDGVRIITQKEYDSIIANAKIVKIGNEEITDFLTNDSSQKFESYSEGNKKEKFSTYYERNRQLRKQAILIHGTTCKVCGMNFESKYGEYGKDFIHVHHKIPLSEYLESKIVDPETDMTVLCPNCHAMIHRYRTKTLSTEELSTLLQ